MLPFSNLNNINDNKKRKYTCFCCAREFKYEQFEEFKRHIIEEHEEGRDYVLCPLERCKTPVRDIKTHFKARHPYDKLPSCKQMKSIIWRDVKGKRIKHKVHFKEGTFDSSKMNGKQIHYRSGFERDVYQCLELLTEVVAYDAEKVEIPYWYVGERHIYRVDLQIVFTDTSIELWEVKPSDQTSDPKNIAKWKAAKEYCLTRGWIFQVITEKELKKLQNKIRLERNEGK